jgi:hypothetical protein
LPLIQGSKDPCSLLKNNQEPVTILSFEELLRDIDASALPPALAWVAIGGQKGYCPKQVGTEYAPF